MQSTWRDDPGLHVGLVMDGNGRWATRRGLPRADGHRAGLAAARAAVRAAPALGIGTLTLYALSSDNFRRPAAEVAEILRLAGAFLRATAGEARREGVRVSVIGRRDRLPPALARLVAAAERFTRPGTRLHLRLAVDYSARDLLAAAATLGEPLARDRVPALLARVDGSGVAVPPADLLVRTGGERRLSDFLLWDAAYAELAFLPVLWPDFTPGDFRAALADFGTRDRRFGALGAAS